MSVASKIKNLTGPGNTDRFGIGGTDLGVTVAAPGGRLVSVFGDTFDKAGVGGPGWRSPVVLFGDPASARTGIEWTGTAGSTDYAQQVLAYEHGSVIDGYTVTSVLPTDVITIGEEMYLHVMLCEGLGNVHWTEIHHSSDNGQTWSSTGARWPGDYYGGLFQMLTCEHGDDGYAYVFSTGFQRDKGLVLQRVPAEWFAEPAAWQTWGYRDGAWAWGNPPNVVVAGEFGELCLRRVEGRWLLALFDAGNYRIDVVSLDSPTGELLRRTASDADTRHLVGHRGPHPGAGGSTLRRLPRTQLHTPGPAPDRQPVEHHQLALPGHAIPRKYHHLNRQAHNTVCPRQRGLSTDPSPKPRPTDQTQGS